MSQVDAARHWGVDVSVIIKIRRTVKDAVLVALSRKPGRQRQERDWVLEVVRQEIADLTDAIKAQAVELGLLRGNPRWA
jgi:hypothetical protein